MTNNASQSIADRLAEYAVGLKFEQLPADVVHRAKSIILDSIGCAIGAYVSDSEPVRIAETLAAASSSTPPATALCSGMKTSLDMAVYLNGTQIRYLDFNDGFTSKTPGHPSDNLAALLSVAEVSGASGRELIVATVAAYEVNCRLGDALNIVARGLDNVVLGAIASAAGSARLFGLSKEQASEAINLALAANISLFLTRVANVSMWKGCAHANASRNAVFAAQLAANGMKGPSPVFEGKCGFLSLVEQELELPPFGGGDVPFKIMECSTKRYPIGQYSQSVVQAAIQVREQIGDIADIAEVDIRTCDFAVKVMADTPDKWRPTNRETADHSMPYTAGVALMYGTVEAKHFGEVYMQDPKLISLISKIKCGDSEEANSRVPEAMLCDFDVVLKSGEKESVRVEYHLGHWRNPMSDTQVEEKFLSLSDDVVSEASAKKLISFIWNIDREANIRELFDLAKV